MALKRAADEYVVAMDQYRTYRDDVSAERLRRADAMLERAIAQARWNELTQNHDNWFQLAKIDEAVELGVELVEEGAA